MRHSTKLVPSFDERVGGWDNFYDLFITQNKTQREIAEMFGVSREAVRSYAHKHGLCGKPKELLTENRDILDALSHELLEKETMDADEFIESVKKIKERRNH